MDHMKKYLINSCLLFICLTGLGFFSLSSAAQGGQPNLGNNACPVGLVSGLELDEEFGPGTQELTRCLERRHNVKVVIQVNQFCRDTWNKAGDRVRKITDCDPGRAYALGNIKNMLNDYEITHGMRPGKDFEVVAVVHSGGGDLILQDGYTFTDIDKGDITISNPYQADVETLLERGVRFLFCQNTTRGFIRNGKLPSYDQGEGSATDAMIPGIEYTTAGVTAIADLQSKGYDYVQP
jgi:intracellular sulfur oxidation DsrE/DsrF family protein